MADVLKHFSEPVRTWFSTTFTAPTTAQEQGWGSIARGDHTLILAPTGSGKTLAAFLWALDQTMTRPGRDPKQRLRTLYLSPLRALAVDVDKNLRAPLLGIQLAAERLGIAVHEPTVGVRTGDTDQRERQRMLRNPPDILITTPESLYLLLTSRARETLAGIDTVIVDEIHALAGTKRGAHLAVSLERLEETTSNSFQRIGLSATQRPLSETAKLLGGYATQPNGGQSSSQANPLSPSTAVPGLTPPGGEYSTESAPEGQRLGQDPGAITPLMTSLSQLSKTDREDMPATARPVAIVDAGVSKALELEVVVPVADLGNLAAGRDDEDARARRSIWPAIHPALLDRILANHTTLVFVNARRLAERLAAQLNELHLERLRREAVAALGPAADPIALEQAEALTVPDLVRAHHGSLSRERRLQIEDDLKGGRLRGLVATSSLELGIDMGAVDLVVQIGSPGAVARGLQRVGRSGHRVGEPSRGTFFPRHRGDLLETAVVVDRMRDGAIEATHHPRNPLDVLAQQIVAMVAMDEWAVADLAAVVRRAAPFHDLDDSLLHAVLDLLDGRYPSEEFSQLRARLVWDRIAGTVRGRQGAQRLAVTNPGTIPDRGLFGVFLPDGARVGELDEEMVHESRVGETFLLGASTWRIEDITYERVIVTPAPGEPGKMPFWHGDGPGRPAELGAAIGAFTRTVRANAADDRDLEVARLGERCGLDARAADNLVSYLDEQAAATGTVPDDRTIVVERFRDELGDWRLCLLSPFGAQVHAPWAMAMQRQLLDRGIDPEVLWSDDGIAIRIEEAVDQIPIEDLLVAPEDIDRLVVEQLGGTALFTTVFREAAGRALLLPKRRPDQRTALWQQRQKAANLLQVAARHPQFPITLEATRECLQDRFDLPALRTLLTDLRSRRVRLVTVDTDRASPFAQSLLFTWVGTYLYDYDAPLAERRAAALSLDRDLLAALLGAEGLRELLDPGALADLELELQHLVDGRRARDADEAHDLLRRLGPLTPMELDARCALPPGKSLDRLVEELVEQRRAIQIGIGGTIHIAAAEDAARLRDALGVALPAGLPQAFTDPVARPMEALVGRWAATHGPFTTHDVARRFGVHAERVEHALLALQEAGRVVSGAFRPGGAGTEWCDDDVLRRLRRRSLAVLRREVEPVDPVALARFLPAWHGIGGPRRRGPDAVAEVIGQLQGAPLPASTLDADIMAARVTDYTPADLDTLLASGEVVWAGAGALGPADGRLVLAFRDQAHLLLPEPADDALDDTLHAAIRGHLGQRGASFWPELFSALGVADQDAVLAALWDLVWSGEVTNDGLAAVRALGGSRRATAGRKARGRGRPRPGTLRRVGPPTAQGRWSLTADLRQAGAPPAASLPATAASVAASRATEIAHARAASLLERHGVITREAVLAEGVPGGFAAVYPVLKAMEEAGTVRRGWFVEGLGATQFALPGAVDRLRDARDAHDRAGRDTSAIVVLAATDPAQPYGAALAWPDSPGHTGRNAGAHVVLVNGQAAAYLERGAKSLVVFADAGDGAGDPGRDHDPDRQWPAGLVSLVRSGRLGRIRLARINGVAAVDAGVAGVAQRLRGHGFVDEPRGLSLHG